MTAEIADPIDNIEPEEEYSDDRHRRLLLLILLLLLMLCCCVSFLFLQYLMNRTPLPELIPGVNLSYPPHYLFSIYGLDGPVGVATSPDGGRIYVAETRGERLIKVFDRNGTPLFSFAPPNTTAASRSPVYFAVHPNGMVFVTDRLQNAIYIYDADGKYIDTILSPTLTLSEYVSKHSGGLSEGMSYSYNIFENAVRYQKQGEQEQLLPSPDKSEWNPLGIRFDNDGNLMLTDPSGESHVVRVFPEANLLNIREDFNPSALVFGSTGQGQGEFLYPNVAVADSKSRYYVSDGNNGRISVWDPTGTFLFDFGANASEGALSLPRGMFINEKDQLHIVDAVGQDVKVYDVSGDTPVFQFLFGGWGADDGLFNYPNDIWLDNIGRIYVADRENNRVEVWSY